MVKIWNNNKTIIMDKIIKAWCIEGINPEYHRKQQERLRKEWPAMYNAIQEAIKINL